MHHSWQLFRKKSRQVLMSKTRNVEKRREELIWSMEICTESWKRTMTNKFWLTEGNLGARVGRAHLCFWANLNCCHHRSDIPSLFLIYFDKKYKLRKLTRKLSLLEGHTPHMNLFPNPIFSKRCRIKYYHPFLQVRTRKDCNSLRFMPVNDKFLYTLVICDIESGPANNLTLLMKCLLLDEVL